MQDSLARKEQDLQEPRKRKDISVQKCKIRSSKISWMYVLRARLACTILEDMQF